MKVKSVGNFPVLILGANRRPLPSHPKQCWILCKMGRNESSFGCNITKGEWGGGGVNSKPIKKLLLGAQSYCHNNSLECFFQLSQVLLIPLKLTTWYFVPLTLYFEWMSQNLSVVFICLLTVWWKGEPRRPTAVRWMWHGLSYLLFSSATWKNSWWWWMVRSFLSPRPGEYKINSL